MRGRRAKRGEAWAARRITVNNADDIVQVCFAFEESPRGGNLKCHFLIWALGTCHCDSYLGVE